MDYLAKDFARAHKTGSGYQLAETLSPVAPKDDPGHVRAVWESTSFNSVKADIRHAINSTTAKASLDSDEIKGWVEVYAAYWKAIGELLAVENEDKVSLMLTLLLQGRARHQTFCR